MKEVKSEKGLVCWLGAEGFALMSSVGNDGLIDTPDVMIAY